jgi:hypothetical protein
MNLFGLIALQNVAIAGTALTLYLMRRRVRQGRRTATF